MLPSLNETPTRKSKGRWVARCFYWPLMSARNMESRQSPQWGQDPSLRMCIIYTSCACACACSFGVGVGVGARACVLVWCARVCVHERVCLCACAYACVYMLLHGNLLSLSKETTASISSATVATVWANSSWARALVLC